MLYQRGAGLPVLPAGRGNATGKRHTNGVSRFLSKTTLPIGNNRYCATELRGKIRKRGVATIPACTPVPPVESGSAAGGARIAPPASALPFMAAHPLATSGTKPFPREILSIGKSVHSSRPRAAHGLDFPARALRPGPDCRLGPEHCLAPKRTLRDRSSVSRPGPGELAHLSR